MRENTKFQKINIYNKYVGCKIQEIKKKIYNNYHFEKLNQKLEIKLLLLIAIITTFQQFIDNKIINISMVFIGYLNAEKIMLQIQKPLANNIYAYLGIDKIGDDFGHSICVIKRYQTQSGIKLLTKNSWGSMRKGYKKILNHQGYIEPDVLENSKKDFKYYIGYLNYTMTIPKNQRQIYVEQELSKTLKKITEICRKEITPSKPLVGEQDIQEGKEVLERTFVNAKDTKRSFFSRIGNFFTKRGGRKCLNSSRYKRNKRKKSVRTKK